MALLLLFHSALFLCFIKKERECGKKVLNLGGLRETEWGILERRRVRHKIRLHKHAKVCKLPLKKSEPNDLLELKAENMSKTNMHSSLKLEFSMLLVV